LFVAQGCSSLRAVIRSGLFIAQGCSSLRAVHRSGLLSAQGCSSLGAVHRSGLFIAQGCYPLRAAPSNKRSVTVFSRTQSSTCVIAEYLTQSTLADDLSLGVSIFQLRGFKKAPVQSFKTKKILA